MRALAFALVLVLGSWTGASAQIDPPNRAGVSASHLNFIVSDIAANKAFWVALGGTPIPADGVEVVSFPGLFIVLTPGEPSGSAEGSVVRHVAFRVRSFAQVEARGLIVERRRIEDELGARELAVTVAPSGDRVELFEEDAIQVRFRADEGHADSGSNRHNEPLTAAIVPHHLHLYVPPGEDTVAQQWYGTMFGAVPGIRLRYPSADVPGMNFNFSISEAALAPTMGRTIDHMGFEVRNLDQFAQRLTQAGIAIQRQAHDGWSGRPVIRFVDPWGMSIAVVEARR